jgi:hypothetical protein
MKGIAFILISSILILGTEHLWDRIQLSAESAVMESCCGCCNTQDDNQNEKVPCGEDHDCLPGCDCMKPFQLTGIKYSLMEESGTVVLSYHYGHYINSYSYEYSDSFLQPPRLV